MNLVRLVARVLRAFRAFRVGARRRLIARAGGHARIFSDRDSVAIKSARASRTGTEHRGVREPAFTLLGVRAEAWADPRLLSAASQWARRYHPRTPLARETADPFDERQ